MCVGGGGGGGGGGGCLNRWVRVGERFSPFNVHKWVLKLRLKKSGKSNVLRRK